MTTLANLPTEIHHEIFIYLDYVRDICCHRYLHVPRVSIPSSIEEFDDLMMMAAIGVSKDHHQIDQPLFLTCKSLLKSVTLFKPTILNLQAFSSKRLCLYPLDSVYLDVELKRYPWIQHHMSKKKDETVVTTSFEWIDVVKDFVKKMRSLCKTNPFSAVEFVSFSNNVGKNYCGYQYAYFFSNLMSDFINLIPSTKYMLMDFNPSLNSVTMKNPKLASVTIVHVCTMEHYKSSITCADNVYWNCSEWEQCKTIPITDLKKAFPRQYPTNIEIFLFNSILSFNGKETDDIINNFKLDIDLFSNIWNIRCHVKQNQFDNVTNLTAIMNALQKVYQKYPSFTVFRIPINDMSCLKLITSYPFVNINVANNITKLFLETLTDEESAVSFSETYNVDFSKLACLKFSVECFFRSSNYSAFNYFRTEKHARDNFGISASMHRPDCPGNFDINSRDMFGNNVLHYFFNNTSNNTPTTISLLRTEISASDLKRLEEEANHVGVTPTELGIFNKFNSTTFENNFNRKFNFEGFTQSFGGDHPKLLLLLDGLVVDTRILLATMNAIGPKLNYEDYSDINFRDQNGQHLMHYTSSCFNASMIKHLKLQLPDVIFCKDDNQTIPIQTCTDSFHTILNSLGGIENLPRFNFVSYTDNFGLCRLLYLLIDKYINTERLVEEICSVGFDYPANGQPTMISLCSHYSDGLYHFSIEESPLMQLRNVNYFGTVDGDDISHFMVRFYLHVLSRNPYHYLFNPILASIISKGLKLDVVRNSKGETALDLLQNFTRTSPTIDRLIKNLIHDCRKGRTTKSKALAKFTIKYTNLPEQLIVEKSDRSLVIRASTAVAKYRIRINRSLYFEPQLRKPVMN